MYDESIRSMSQLKAEDQDLAMGLYKWYTYSYQFMSSFFQAEFRVLVRLVEGGEQPATPSDLAKLLGVTRQRVTTLLTGLRNKGFIEMEPDARDRRRTLLRITEAGMEHFVRESERFGTALEYMHERIGSEGVRQFIDLIDKLIPEGEK